MDEINEKERKMKSLVVHTETWQRLNKLLHFEGRSSMNKVIDFLLDIYEKQNVNQM